MATKVEVKVTFEAANVIEPVSTGGEVSANASGSLLATIVDDDVQIVETSTRKSLVRIDGDGEAVTSLAFSPTGSHIVVCSRSLSMTIYALSDGETGVTAKALRTLKPHTSPVVSSTIDPTGSLLATGGADGVVKVWDVRGGYCSHTFHGHGGLVTAVELFESNTSVSQRKSSKSKKRKSQTDGDTVMDDAASISTILLASGGEDGRIKIWDLNTRKAVATLESHVSVVRSINYSSEQETILSASRDKTLVVWDARSWQPKRIIPTLEVIETAGYIINGRFCYAGGEHGKLRVWEAEMGREITERQDPGLETEIVVTVVKIPMEDALLVVHQDQTMTLQSFAPLSNLGPQEKLSSLPVIRRISGNHDQIIDMACVGSERSLLALATNTESIKITSTANDTEDGLMSEFGQDIAMLEGHQDVIICLDVDWSGHWLATGAKDNTARLWRINSTTSKFECIAVFAGHAESIGAIALPHSPEAGTAAAKDPLSHPPAYLITGSQDKTVKKWDTSKLSLSNSHNTPQDIAKSAYTRVAHEQDINAIDVSPIAPLFASASQDKTIKIWSIEDGSVTGILKDHKRGVWSVRFSPAGMAPLSLPEGGNSSSRGLLVSASGDRTVKLWSLSTYTCLMTFQGHTNSVLKVLWLPSPGLNRQSESSQQRSNRNQPIIASASSDQLVKLWSPYASLETGNLLCTLNNHTDRVWSLASPLPAISNDETQGPKSDQHPNYTFISGAADATLTFWRDTTSETATKTSVALAKRIEEDQQLQNHIHARNYRESILLSLSLNYPRRLLEILSKSVHTPETEQEPDSILGTHAVDQVLSNLTQEQIYLLLHHVRDWHTRERTLQVGVRVMYLLFKKYPQSLWTDMAKNRELARRVHAALNGVSKFMGLKELFRALEVWSERHYERVQDMLDQTYIIDYTLMQMDEVQGAV